MRRLGLTLVAVWLAVTGSAQAVDFPKDVETKDADIYGLVYSERSLEARARTMPKLKREFAARGWQWGAPVFVRIFKQPSLLEVWVQGSNGRYEQFKTYPVCERSGGIGPKLRKGDEQSPEGFYSLTSDWMHPYSDYHLGFNVRYPNDYDRMQGATGHSIMVHGDCASTGCFAMTDPLVEEIYTLMEAAFKNGEPYLKVHIFPFPMTEKNLKPHVKSRWYSFWLNLKEGYDMFLENGVPPDEYVVDGRYYFSERTQACVAEKPQPELTPELEVLLQPKLPVAESTVESGPVSTLSTQ